MLKCRCIRRHIVNSLLTFFLEGPAYHNPVVPGPLSYGRNSTLHAQIEIYSQACLSYARETETMPRYLFPNARKMKPMKSLWGRVVREQARLRLQLKAELVAAIE